MPCAQDVHAAPALAWCVHARGPVRVRMRARVHASSPRACAARGMLARRAGPGALRGARGRRARASRAVPQPHGPVCAGTPLQTRASPCAGGRGGSARGLTRGRGAHRQRTTGRGSTTRPPRTPRRAFFICDGGVNLRIPPPPRCSHSRPPPRLLGLHWYGVSHTNSLRVRGPWDRVAGPCRKTPVVGDQDKGRAVRVSRAEREARRPGAARMGHADASRAH